MCLLSVGSFIADIALIQVFRTFNASNTLQDQLEELTDGECPISIPTCIPHSHAGSVLINPCHHLSTCIVIIIGYPLGLRLEFVNTN